MSHTRIATTSGANNFQFNFIRNSPYYFKTKIEKIAYLVYQKF